MPKFSVLQPEVNVDHYNIVKLNTKKPKTETPATSQNNNVVKKGNTTKKGTTANKNENNVKNQMVNSVSNDAEPKKKKKKGKDDVSNTLHSGRFSITLELVFHYIFIGIIKLFLYITLMVSKLMAMAFGTPGNKKGNKTTVTNPKSVPTAPPTKTNAKKVKNKAQIEGEDDWEKRDNEFIASVNSKSLEEGILLSKLENQKKVATRHSEEKENNNPKEPQDVKKKTKKKKTTTISLDEFQRGTTAESNKKNASTVNEEVPKKKSKKVKEKFFEDVQETTKSTLLKEKQQQDRFKNNLKNEERKAMEVTYTAKVEQRDFEIQALRLEVDSLKRELTNVKQRNKKLCEVIGCSEMKPKGELVVQLEKAVKCRDEYCSEVSKLLAELEQEKTKVSNLTQDVKKLQGRRN